MTTGKVAPDFHRNLGAWGSATRVRHIMPNVSHVSDRPRQFQRTVRLRLLISDFRVFPLQSECAICNLIAQLNILQTVVLTNHLHAEHTRMYAEAELRPSVAKPRTKEYMVKPHG